MLLFFNIFTSNFGTNKSNHWLTTLYIHNSFNMPWNDKERCFPKRVRVCLQRGGAHLQHILKWRNHSKFDKILIFCLYQIKCHWLMFMFITNKNAKALKLHSVILLCPLSFDDLFLTEFMVKITNHAHIRDQQVKIYKNQCFVFKFT